MTECNHPVEGIVTSLLHVTVMVEATLLLTDLVVLTTDNKVTIRVNVMMKIGHLTNVL